MVYLSSLVRLLHRRRRAVALCYAIAPMRFSIANDNWGDNNNPTRVVTVTLVFWGAADDEVVKFAAGSRFFSRRWMDVGCV